MSLVIPLFEALNITASDKPFHIKAYLKNGEELNIAKAKRIPNPKKFSNRSHITVTDYADKAQHPFTVHIRLIEEINQTPVAWMPQKKNYS